MDLPPAYSIDIDHHSGGLRNRPEKDRQPRRSLRRQLQVETQWQTADEHKKVNETRSRWGHSYHKQLTIPNPQDYPAVKF